jgi:hypothetical protein
MGIGIPLSYRTRTSIGGLPVVHIRALFSFHQSLNKYLHWSGVDVVQAVLRDIVWATTQETSQPFSLIEQIQESKCSRQAPVHPGDSAASLAHRTNPRIEVYSPGSSPAMVQGFPTFPASTSTKVVSCSPLIME